MSAVARGNGRGTYDVGFGSNRPVLVTSLRQALDNVGLVSHQPEQTHDLFTTSADPASRPSGHANISSIQDSPSQHVTLFRLFQDQDQLVDPVDFVFDTLNQRSKGIGDVID